MFYNVSKLSIAFQWSQEMKEKVEKWFWQVEFGWTLLLIFLITF